MCVYCFLTSVTPALRPSMLFINDVTVLILVFDVLLPIALNKSKSFVASVINISLLLSSCVDTGMALRAKVKFNCESLTSHFPGMFLPLNVSLKVPSSLNVIEKAPGSTPNLDSCSCNLSSNLLDAMPAPAFANRLSDSNIIAGSEYSHVPTKLSVEACFSFGGNTCL